jgi:4-diphosphocytidyl-2-C-methyl-D-erythritol kinase
VSEWTTATARAKVNLRLRIFPAGADGFHPIETLFCRISLADEIRVRLTSAPGVALSVSGPEGAPTGGDNLAARAAALFLERTGSTGGAEIELEKRIPAGSGLGGGSSDAAATLRALDRATGGALLADDLLALGARLGSDVPFFVADRPFALGWGRGERLLGLEPPSPRAMLVVVPEIRVPTSTAYDMWDDARSRDVGERQDEALAVDANALSDWDSIAERASNDFESVILKRHPELEGVRSELRATGPRIVLLSGSGSAFVGVYDSPDARDAAARRLEERERATVLCVSGPE